MVTAFVTGGCILRKTGQEGQMTTRHALDRARKAGIRLFIATGRHFLEVDSENLLDGLAFDAYITLNGQYCYEGTLAVRSSISTLSPAARLPSSLRYWNTIFLPVHGSGKLVSELR